MCKVKMSPKAGNSKSQSWANIYSMEITSEECLMGVKHLLSCPSTINTARGFQGQEAQMFADFLDRVLSDTRLDDKLRRRGMLLLTKTCGACAIIPSSYILQYSIREGSIHYHGGYADVRKGEYLERLVAVKHLRIREEDSDRAFKRLCREVIGWKHLDHQNILPLLGVSVSRDPYRFRILTDWMPNGNVMRYARLNPEANRLRLLSEVASGVVYLHNLRIVHGDLKGANILVDENGTARLADFGLMTILSEHNAVGLSATTVSSAGTVCWMSPEILLGQTTSPTCQTDCYALGMVIYEVLTGLRPFHHLGPFAVVAAVQKGVRPQKPPKSKSLGLSETLWELVRRCWDQSPEARPTAKQLLLYLQDASRSWVPPAEYPVPDDAGFEPTFGDEGCAVTSAQENCTLLSVFFMLWRKGKHEKHHAKKQSQQSANKARINKARKQNHQGSGWSFRAIYPFKHR